MVLESWLSIIPTISGGHLSRGVRGAVVPNNFRLAKCDTQFITSRSQEAIKNNVQVSVLV